MLQFSGLVSRFDLDSTEKSDAKELLEQCSGSCSMCPISPARIPCAGLSGQSFEEL